MRTIVFLLLAALAAPALAHDTWVEPNTNLVRAGDAVHLDLKLGNHGNDHRDFKLAGKVDLDGCTFDVIAPEGTKYDLKDRLIDTGYAPKEGYWTAKFSAVKPGLYLAAHTLDQVAHYAPVRSIKSAKTFFVVSKGLDRVSTDNPGFGRALGHPLELVPVANPVTPMGPGQTIAVRLLYKGKPFEGARVSFIPRSQPLKEEFDPQFERLTDAEGRAAFIPTSGDMYLVVAHHVETEEAGDGYKSTKYSATLTVFVPEVCPCCGE